MSSHTEHDTASSCVAPPAGPIVVVGSVNVDITVKVARPPRLEETVMATDPGVTYAVGGKGANQAVAAARLVAGSRRVKFVGQFGGDAHAAMLAAALSDNGVDVSLSGHHPHLPSGQGIVMLSPHGEASSVVVGGANARGWPADPDQLRGLMANVVAGAAVVMLQREVPEFVNLAAAAAATAAGVPIVLDAGGADTPLPAALITAADYLCPNESELARLTGGAPTHSSDAVVNATRGLLRAGARRVFVTLGERGAVLVRRTDPEDGSVHTTTWHPPVPVPGSVMVDGTAAGDAFRAGLAVALAEGGGGGHLAEHGVRLAAAAGAWAVSVAGAVPSLPTRVEAEALLPSEQRSPPPRNDLRISCDADHFGDAAGGDGDGRPEDECPLRFGSRLNSMKARPDLWKPSASTDDGSFGPSWWPFGGGKKKTDDGELRVLDMVRRLGMAEGVSLVDFNYPQHLAGLTPGAVTAALAAARLGSGAVAVRFPPSEYRSGALTNPDASVRAAAVDVVAGACDWAKSLRAVGGVVIWPQFDGYDYHLQVNHTEVWNRGVDALRAALDRPECHGVKLSYEFKPTDASSRFAVVPSTGAALQLVRDVNRPGRFGLTLDAGHLMAAGENPAASAAAVATAGALFGVQLGDAHSKLGAEDGLAFGSVHAAGALELVYWLRATRYGGHVYFDTFPEAEDPVREAAFNVRAFKRMWRQAVALEKDGMGEALLKHDAMGSLEMQEKLVRWV